MLTIDRECIFTADAQQSFNNGGDVLPVETRIAHYGKRLADKWLESKRPGQTRCSGSRDVPYPDEARQDSRDGSFSAALWTHHQHHLLPGRIPGEAISKPLLQQIERFRIPIKQLVQELMPGSRSLRFRVWVEFESINREEQWSRWKV